MKIRHKYSPFIQALPIEFECIYCNHKCGVKMDRKSRIGSIMCAVCKNGFKTKINPLHEPIDVYVSWKDSIEP